MKQWFVSTILLVTSSTGFSAPDFRVDIVGRKFVQGQKVLIRFHNKSGQDVTLFSSKASIVTEAGTVVYAAPKKSRVVKKGTWTKYWEWDQRSNKEKQVPDGKYRARMTVSWAGQTKVVTSSSFTIVPPKLTYFPLNFDNLWHYRSLPLSSSSAQKTMHLKGHEQYWADLDGFIGTDEDPVWAFMTKDHKLIATDPCTDKKIPLFQFQREKGYSYKVNFCKGLEGATLTVGSTNDTVKTAAGVFTGCYRLDVTYSQQIPTGYKSFTFATNIGLVQYVQGGLTFQLHHAVLHPVNGDPVKIGKP